MKTSSFLAAFAAASATGLILVGAAQVATAADFDGSKPLICAPVEAHDCVADEKCATGSPAKLGLPTFLRVNVKDKTVQGTHRTTPIKVIEETDTQILMMGTELGAGWTMALDRLTGSVVISMATSEGAAVLFGSCTTL